MIKPGVFLAPNLSDRFECRFVSVRFEKCPAIMCKNMEGSTFGVWIAHGEGIFTLLDNLFYFKFFYLFTSFS